MLHILLVKYLDSPRRIFDALPLSTSRGGRPRALGVFGGE
jgi:hypothetical protein